MINWIVNAISAFICSTIVMLIVFINSEGMTVLNTAIGYAVLFVLSYLICIIIDVLFDIIVGLIDS